MLDDAGNALGGWTAAALADSTGFPSLPQAPPGVRERVLARRAGSEWRLRLRLPHAGGPQGQVAQSGPAAGKSPTEDLPLFTKRAAAAQARAEQAAAAHARTAVRACIQRVALAFPHTPHTYGTPPLQSAASAPPPPTSLPRPSGPHPNQQHKDARGTAGTSSGAGRIVRIRQLAPA